MKLHLRTQGHQPYGSVRLCCERCGAYMHNPDYTHETDSREEYEANPARCSQPSTPERSRALDLKVVSE